MPPKEETAATATSHRQSSYDSIQDNALIETTKPVKRNPNDPDAPTNEYVLNVAFYSFIGFVIVQAVFAWIAKSQSMMADSEAMSVDALTYLFNLCAERIKHRPFSAGELALPLEWRNYRREKQRLYLEVIPPLVSVVTLISVTIMTLREAWQTLFQMRADDEAAAAMAMAHGGQLHDDNDDVVVVVSVPIMLLFSAANLLLDVVNVTCFARAQSAFGLDVVKRTTTATMDGSSPIAATRDEQRTLLHGNEEEEADNCCPQTAPKLVNLNMCSAWTHVCADTLRSTAVLIAAGLAYFLPSHVDGDAADAIAAIAVSVIIFGSLLPLLHGLVLTANAIRHLQPPSCAVVVQV